MDDPLTSAGPFQGLSREDRVAIARDFLRMNVFRGQVLFREGEPPDFCLYVVVSGKVKMGRRSADGRENLVDVVGPSDHFGDLSLFDGGPRTATAVAVAAGCIARIHKSDLLGWIERRPQIGLELLRLGAVRQRKNNGLLADQIFMDVPGRVAKRLLDLADRFGADHGDTIWVTHELTQEELAQFVGAARETVNKVLIDFAIRGWIRSEIKSIEILDVGELRRRSGSTASSASQSLAANPATHTTPRP
jgi:CRP/FNR family cyclic AMP-dependent transcriptional regulator